MKRPKQYENIQVLHHDSMKRSIESINEVLKKVGSSLDVIIRKPSIPPSHLYDRIKERSSFESVVETLSQFRKKHICKFIYVVLQSGVESICLSHNNTNVFLKRIYDNSGCRLYVVASVTTGGSRLPSGECKGRTFIIDMDVNIIEESHLRMRRN
jgi:predicted transcriptional regulator